MKKLTLILFIFMCLSHISLAQIDIIAENEKQYAVDESCTASVEYCFTVMDSTAVDSTLFRWEILVDLWSDWSIDYTFSSDIDSLDDNYGTPENELYLAPSLSEQPVCITLPDLVNHSKLDHRITIIAASNDGLGSNSFTFEISDLTPPTVSVVQESELQNDFGIFEFDLSASDLVIAASDHCSPDIKYTFHGPDEGFLSPQSTPGWNPDLDSEEIQLVSTDFDINGNAGQALIDVYVWDACHNSIKTEVLIKASGFTAEDFLTHLQGSVTHWSGSVLPEAEILIFDVFAPEFPLVLDVNEDGEFNFMYYEGHNSGSLTAFDHKVVRNGVSSLDVVLLQRHISGEQPFENAYQYIAGDIDNNQVIDQNDVDELIALIQLEIDTFSNNRSWRFHYNEAPLEINSPFEIVETLVMDTIAKYSNKPLDFIGIKIGDINSSSFNLATSTEEVQSSSAFTVVESNNPFSESMTFNIEMEDPSRIELSIFNTNGQVVYQHVIEGLDSSLTFDLKSSMLPSLGTYYCRFTVSGVSITRKLVYIN